MTVVRDMTDRKPTPDQFRNVLYLRKVSSAQLVGLDVDDDGHPFREDIPGQRIDRKQPRSN